MSDNSAHMHSIMAGNNQFLSPASSQYCAKGALMAPAVATYQPRDPSKTVLYQVIVEHLETFLASLDDDPDAKGLPAYVQREFDDYLQCGADRRIFGLDE